MPHRFWASVNRVAQLVMLGAVSVASEASIDGVFSRNGEGWQSK